MRPRFHIPTRSYQRSPHWLVSLLCLLWLSLACANAQANTFTVTTLSDSGMGSLRQAITDANANAGADSIVFANGLTGTIALTSALPNLTEDVALTGPGAKTLTVARSSAAGTPAFRILTIDAGTATPPTVSISGLTLANGSVALPLSSPVAPPTGIKNGGGAVSSNKANVTLSDCVITNNSSSGFYYYRSSPYGLSHPILSAGARGGGVYNYQGIMTLTRCTISNNSASLYPTGGGLCNEAGTLNLASCTISGNQANGGKFSDFLFSGPGGGLWNSGTLNLTGCTFANNSTSSFVLVNGTPSSGPGLGSSLYNSGTSNTTYVSLYQTLLASGSSSGGQNVVSASGIVLTSLGYNVSNDASGPNDSATDRLNMDARLSQLGDYGGPTPTHVPLPGSPALDAGDPNFDGNPATDQRGLPRVFNGRVDIGAVERQPVELVAFNDAYSVKHDRTLRVTVPGVLANDIGQAPLSAVLVASAANGTIILNADGSFVYTPNAGYGALNNSTDSFTYQAQDGNGHASNVATVVITIIPDSLPVLTNSLSATTPLGKLWNFTATATDPDLPDDALTFALVNAPAGMSINGAMSAIAWTPQTAGVFTFGLKVTDLYGRSDQQTFTLTVFDSAPALTNSLTGTATAGQAWNFTATATDADLPEDALAFSLVNAPSGMSINASTGAITWTPKTEGTATFDIKVTDRYGKSDQKTFTLMVQSDPNGSVSLSITNVTLQRTNTNTVTVSFNVVNSGTGKATNLVISRATLGPWLSVLNALPVSVGAGNKQAYTLTFSGVTPLPKVVYPLQIRGTYQAQSVTQTLFYGGGVSVP